MPNRTDEPDSNPEPKVTHEDFVQIAVSLLSSGFQIHQAAQGGCPAPSKNALLDPR
jgi:hypothetical protein